MAPILTGEPCSNCGGGGGGGSFACADLADCALDDLGGVDLTGASDGDVLTLDGTTWTAAAPSAGGAWKDFAEAFVTGGNSTVPSGLGDVSNLADLTLDAATDDLVEVTFDGIFFGPQTFYSVRVTSGTPRSLAMRGWYYTSIVGNQGGWSWAPFKFLVLATDLTAATITLQMQGDAQGGPATILEGSVFQATNLGQRAA